MTGGLESASDISDDELKDDETSLSSEDEGQKSRGNRGSDKKVEDADVSQDFNETGSTSSSDKGLRFLAGNSQ